MPIPNLIHPVTIEIQQKDSADTEFDEDAREPVQFITRDQTVTCPGQVNWGASMDASHSRGGAGEDADGYVLFRYVDLNERSITLQREDRIISIGGVAANVYIKKLRPTGHYPDVDGPTLLRAYFEDRQPSRLVE